MNTEIILEAGDYFIGELLYVLFDDEESSILIRQSSSNQLKKISLPNDRFVVCFRSRDEAGRYYDNEMNEYDFDIGVIGCVPVNFLNEDENPNLDAGKIVSFSESFSVILTDQEFRVGDTVISFSSYESDDFEEED